MKTIAAEKEIIELERKFWQALQDQDVEAAQRMSDETCLLTGSQGVMSVNREQLAQMMRAGGYTMNGFQVEDPQVRMVGDDVAIVAYKVREDLTVDGKPLTLEAADASTWVRRDGKWLCALHTESIKGDPFGRDRRQASA
jgi:uncharacterized protein (TIGR02246 family)